MPISPFNNVHLTQDMSTCKLFQTFGLETLFHNGTKHFHALNDGKHAHAAIIIQEIKNHPIVANLYCSSALLQCGESHN